MMVNAQKGFSQNKRDGLGRFQAHEQRVWQTRALSCGYRCEVRRLRPRLGQGGSGNGQKIPQVLPRRQLRHYPSVLGMQTDLGRDNVGQHAALVHHSRAGLITGSFKC
jgi:hypothetical protein